MTLFSPLFFQILIVGSLFLTSVGALLLAVLLYSDYKRKQVW